MASPSRISSGVILAAGLSRRLSPLLKGGTKVTYHIRDLPMILYPFLSLYAIGVREYCVIVNKVNYNSVLSVLENIKLEDFNIELVLNPKPSLGNGYSLLLGNRCVKDDYFFLSMADHIYSPSIPEILLEEFNKGTDMIIGGDSKPRFIDVGEATKIYYRDGKIKAMGKNIKHFTHIDIGVFIMSKEILSLYDTDNLTQPISVTQIVRSAGRAGYNIRVADVVGGYWTEVDTPRDMNELLNGSRKPVLEAFHNEFPLYISQDLHEIYEFTRV